MCVSGRCELYMLGKMMQEEITACLATLERDGDPKFPAMLHCSAQILGNETVR